VISMPGFDREHPLDGTFAADGLVSAFTVDDQKGFYCDFGIHRKRSNYHGKQASASHRV
jgi:hypothetical protein